MGCGGSKADTPAPQPTGAAAEKPNENKKETKQELPEKVEHKQVESDIKQEEASKASEASSTTKEEFSEFEQTALNHHNEYRALHGCPPLSLSRGLCNLAAGWADHLAANKSFEHSKNRDYEGQTAGENLYMTASTAPNVNGDGATKSWYDEIKDYNWNNPGFAMNTGHFTQVVWKGTSQLGIASATYEQDGWHNMLVVANYLEAGNMMGAFEENVPKLV